MADANAPVRPLLKDGTAVAFGDNRNQQATVPAILPREITPGPCPYSKRSVIVSVGVSRYNYRYSLTDFLQLQTSYNCRLHRTAPRATPPRRRASAHSVGHPARDPLTPLRDILTICVGFGAGGLHQN